MCLLRKNECKRNQTTCAEGEARHRGEGLEKKGLKTAPERDRGGRRPKDDCRLGDIPQNARIMWEVW